MKSTFLFSLACVLSLPMIVGCGKEPSEEERLEAEFKAMPPNDDELKDFNADKVSFGSNRAKSAHPSDKSVK